MSCLFILLRNVTLQSIKENQFVWQSIDPDSNFSKSWYADDTTLMAESEEELKSLLMKVKEES